MKYSFGEIRKTVTVAVGAIVTVLLTIINDELARTLIPPQWIAVIGALATIAGVFGIPNDAAPEVQDAVEDAVEAAKEAAHAKSVLPPAISSALPTALTDGIDRAVSTAQAVADITFKLGRR